MSDRPDLSARPDLRKRRTIAVVPAPDEGIDPIDPHKPAIAPVAPAPGEENAQSAAAKLAAVPAAEVPAPAPAPAPAAPAKTKVELPTKDLNLQVTPEVMETIDFAKFKTKLTKREIVQRAVLEYWSEYRPTDG